MKPMNKDQRANNNRQAPSLSASFPKLDNTDSNPLAQMSVPQPWSQAQDVLTNAFMEQSSPDFNPKVNGTGLGMGAVKIYMSEGSSADVAAVQKRAEELVSVPVHVEVIGTIELQ